MDIILASASPRRAQLLEQIGIKFTVQASNVEEKLSKKMEPSLWVQEIALQKAKDVAKNYKEGLVIGADTIVVKDGKILGKPQDELEAIKMLKFLSGSHHQVMTGIAVVNAQNMEDYIVNIEITKVKFSNLKESEILSYVKTKEPMDKAGAYGIQGIGALLVEKIEGCYYNVVGLPLNHLVKILKKYDGELLSKPHDI